MAKAILYDATQCVGCLECEKACAAENNLPYDDTIAAEKLTSAHKYTYVAVKADDKYMRKLCMHCQDPTCVSACPVGALEKTNSGAVTYDESKCMGCRYCMLACPFGVPKYEWTKVLPGVRKCILCSDRISIGQPTACAEACPTGATIVGERDVMLAEAHKRLQENRDAYIQHIYGEKEAGGTSVLMLSSIPFAEFGLPKLGDQPLPHLTADIIEHIPDVATVGLALLGGIWWITNRRDLVAVEDRQSCLSGQARLPVPHEEKE
ncbi:MAG TPA: 4Fe-4S dicluster domain-containing protein [Thermoanaerobaculia bacterium]|nr:4Fe-4S dicluster domain-containing protein [Thermoanaerobaculia bacterium]